MDIQIGPLPLAEEASPHLEWLLQELGETAIETANATQEVIEGDTKSRFVRGMKVHTMVAGDVSPGIVTDPVIRPRQVITKTGILNLPAAERHDEVAVGLRSDGRRKPARGLHEASETVGLRRGRGYENDRPWMDRWQPTEQVVAALEPRQRGAPRTPRRRALPWPGGQRRDWAGLGKTALDL